MTRNMSRARARDALRLDTALWRALGLFRLGAWLYAAASMAAHLDDYDRPALGLAVLGAMGGWTAVAAWAYGRPEWRRRSLLWADLLLAVAAQQSSLLVLTSHQIDAGAPTVAVCWAAAPVLAWAVHGGTREGLSAAAVVGAGALVERGGAAQATVNSIVLLLLVGLVVGYVVTLARRAETDRAVAVALAAAANEREHLAREVHDGVLQVLALVSKQGPPGLAGLAGEQEVRLRHLVSTRQAPLPPYLARLLDASPHAPGPVNDSDAELVDVRELLPVDPAVTVSAPAGEVLLPGYAATELAAATAAAVDNALHHGGGRCWVLVEDAPDHVVVSVRDEGPGVTADRLAAAAAEGRMGVARSITGRIEDLGGSVAFDAGPGRGTEVELRVPRT
jgi:signal transduction histidine kinase